MLGAPIGCGDLGDADEAPPLAVIEGRLDQASVAPASTPANVRVAVIWATTTNDFKKSVDIEATAVFPSKFRVELKNPPPADAMIGGEGGTAFPEPADPTDPADETTDDIPDTKTQDFGASATRWAIGTIVAYEDTNGNGQLDLLRADQPPVDRILGANEQMTLFYFEGEPVSPLNIETRGTPSKGYGFLRAPACVAPRPNQTAQPCDPAEWLSISTLYELPLSTDPQLAEMMCRSSSGTSYSHPSQSNTKPGAALPQAPGADGWPAKDDEGLFCAADGKSYEYVKCVSTSLGLCKGTSESCTDNSYGLPAGPVPAEWPCTVQ